MRLTLVLFCLFVCAASAMGGDCLTLELIGENFDLSTGATTQRRAPAIAYNAVDDEYVVVWFDTQNPGNNDVFGQRVDADGTLLGANFPVIEFADAQIDPCIAHSPATNEYLVAWRTQHGGAFNQGYGRLIAADGGAIGGQFRISNGGFECSIGYNPADDEFLHQARNFAGGGAGGIRGQRVSSAGNLVGPNIGIAQAGAPGPSGQIAFGSVDDMYLATWRNQSDRNLQGQMIAADGSLVGGPILISSLFSESGRAAQQAFDPVNNRFLVIFSEFQGNNVLGQFVSGDGALMGGNFEIASGLLSRVSPRVAFSDAAGAYVVLWREAGAIVAQVLDVDGAVAGDPLTVASGSVGGDPTAAYNPTSGEIMLAWSDNRNLGGGEQDIFAQRMIFNCCDPCDMNCDGEINAFDIEPFLDLLFGGGEPCDSCSGDVDGDGEINAFDIEPFLECLFG